ncbi:hypothetical protein [Roseomonas sp. BN140053]|uniref:hypothetical protein n=1 Tax=Roseomonas sp. BN140053 TaxID=3391898 RepID=UPI0039E9245F
MRGIVVDAALAKGVGGGTPVGIDDALGSGAQQRLPFEAGKLDQVVVQVTGRKLEKAHGVSLDHLSDAGSFVGNAVVHDRYITEVKAGVWIHPTHARKISTLVASSTTTRTTSLPLHSAPTKAADLLQPVFRRRTDHAAAASLGRTGCQYLHPARHRFTEFMRAPGCATSTATRVKERMRHVLVGTPGLPVASRAEPTDTPDQRTGKHQQGPRISSPHLGKIHLQRRQPFYTEPHPIE